MTEEKLEEGNFLLYIYTPFCGTCTVARGMLDKIEAVHGRDIFFEMNASLQPDFMKKYKIESVPCLLIMEDQEVKEKIYAFRSTGNIYSYLMKYKTDLFK